MEGTEKKELPSRSTRGKRMAALIEGEDAKADEEFWNQDYFKEEEEDQEYHSEEEDVVDSDFDNPENEKNEIIISEQDPKKDDLEKKKKLVYVDPKGKKALQKQKKIQNEKLDKEMKDIQQIPTDSAETPPNTELTPKKNKKLKSTDRTLRTSTLDKVLEAQVSRKKLFDKKLKKKAARLKKSSVAEYIPLTQEQLLKEAEETEILNKQSLEVLTAIEEEKKKVVIHKAAIKGPYISYLSTTSERFHSKFNFLPSSIVNPKPLDSNTISLSKSNPNIINVVTFSNGPNTTPPSTDSLENPVQSPILSFPSFFSAAAPQPAKKELCEITSLPAKYKDPMTNVPYATAAAFSSVRSRLKKKPETPSEEMKRKRGRPPLIRSPTPT